VGAEGRKPINLDIVFIGDSITQPKTPVESAAAYLKGSVGVGDVRVSNQGHSGHTTQDFLSADGRDAQGVKAAADAFVSPDRELVFSIMLGTNDSACQGPNGAPMAPATYRANLKLIVDRLLSVYPRAKAVFQYPVWYSTNTYNASRYLEEGQKRLRSYWPEIAALAAEYDVSHPGQIFEGSKAGWEYFEHNHLTDMRHENGQAGVFFLHPNDQGSQTLGKFWGEAIRRAVVGADRVVLHVRPDGDSAGLGTADKPFATVEQARDAIRAAKAAGPLTGGAEVILHGGHYVPSASIAFSAEDSGLAGSPVVYTVAPDEGVSISGAQLIRPTAFRLISDTAMRARLEPAAQGQVLCADLNVLGITKPTQPPDSFRLPFAVPELFFNGKRMPLACWPNEGWATIKAIVDPGTMRNDGSVTDAADPKKARPKENKGGVFTYEGERPSRWKPEAGLWLHGFWCFDWYDDAIRVASIDPVKHEISLKVGHTYGVRQGNPSPRRWRAVNVFEELDRPGEYFIDRGSNLLYFWPPEKLEGARVTLATRDQPLVLLQGVANVTLRGIILEEAQGDAVHMRDCRRVNIEGCVIRNIRRKAIQLDGGADNRIFACDIHDTGTGGIDLGGGDRKTLTPARNVVENTHIWNFSAHQLTYASALHLSGVGNVARHNLIHDAPHQAISVSGNDHLFEYNVISNVCVASDDAAAFYKGRNPSCRGNVLRYNLWRDIGSPRGHGNAAVYFDDGDGGEMVYGNVFFRCGDPGKGSFGTVFSHGGHGNRAENNIFIECKRALGSAPWSDKRWKEFVNAPLWQERLLKDVDITKPPYAERYPELVGFMDPQPGAARDNIAIRNLFVGCGEVKSNRWVTNETDYATADDPGFVNLSGGDFRLKPDSAVFTRIPGFQAVPVEKMGLYRVNVGARKR
jgi:lysophospholipase L1-like esterase